MSRRCEEKGCSDPALGVPRVQATRHACCADPAQLTTTPFKSAAAAGRDGCRGRRRPGVTVPTAGRIGRGQQKAQESPSGTPSATASRGSAGIVDRAAGQALGSSWDAVAARTGHALQLRLPLTLAPRRCRRGPVDRQGLQAGYGYDDERACDRAWLLGKWAELREAGRTAEGRGAAPWFARHRAADMRLGGATPELPPCARSGWPSAVPAMWSAATRRGTAAGSARAGIRIAQPVSMAVLRTRSRKHRHAKGAHDRPTAPLDRPRPVPVTRTVWTARCRSTWWSSAAGTARDGGGGTGGAHDAAGHQVSGWCWKAAGIGRACPVQPAGVAPHVSCTVPVGTTTGG